MALPDRARLQSDLLLLTTAAIWGTAFVACRVAMESLGPFLFNGLRFAVGALALLPWLRRRLRSITRRELWGGALAGAMIFSASGLQQTGMQVTTAGKAGFITSLYIILVPLLMTVVWRRPPRWPAWVAALLAAAGLFLLSGAGRLALAPGDGLVLAGMVFWALHVIVIGRFAGQSDPLRLALVQYLVCSLLSLLVAGGWERSTLGGLSEGWWTVLYTGVFSIGLGYTLQVVGQRRAPPSDAALILSTESVFAAFFGWLLLGETLGALQVAGCGLILTGVVLAQIGKDGQRMRGAD